LKAHRTLLFEINPYVRITVSNSKISLLFLNTRETVREQEGQEEMAETAKATR
jgi:hypothetical protein